MVRAVELCVWVLAGLVLGLWIQFILAASCSLAANGVLVILARTEAPAVELRHLSQLLNFLDRISSLCLPLSLASGVAFVLAVERRDRNDCGLPANNSYLDSSRK